MPLRIPARLAAHASEPAWAGWLDSLPRLVQAMQDEWALAPDGEPMAGSCAIVLPVRVAEGEPAALKVTWPHREAETEHLALRHWGGRSAIRLLRADPHRFALLLERADGARDLRSLPVDDAIRVVAGLYPQLHIAAPPQLRTLSSVVGEWAERMPRLLDDRRVPRRLVEHAASLARDLASDAGTDGTLVHADLHSENVLASLPGAGGAGGALARPPWLATDPKPLSGDPTFEAGPLLGSRWDELPRGRERDELLGRLWVLLDATGWDEDRVRDWIVVRELATIMRHVERGALEPGALDRGITFVKAMQR